MRKDKNTNIKWILILVGLCLLAVLGFYLRSLPELELNRLLVRWLSIILVILVISSAIAIATLWNRVVGEARFREGSQAALRARIFPSPTPYRGYAAQGYGDWPAPPPPEQRPQLRMLPEGLLSDMNETWSA
mgnify:CR=1 FL=1